MAAVTKLQVFPHSLHCRPHHSGGRWPLLSPQNASFSDRRGVYPRPCRSFRSGHGGELEEPEKESARESGYLKKNRAEGEEGSGILSSVKSLFVRVSGLFPRTEEEQRNAVAQLEEISSSVSCNFYLFSWQRWF